MQTPMVRTTIYLPIELIQLAKSVALKKGSTLTGLVKESLEDKLQIKKKPLKKFIWKTHKLNIGKFKRSLAYEDIA